MESFGNNNIKSKRQNSKIDYFLIVIAIEKLDWKDLDCCDL